MKAFPQPQISNSKCLYILCVWVEQSARCFAMQVRVKLQVSILSTSGKPGLWFYGSKMPEQADPPLFGKQVDFVCPSCIRHYVQREQIWSSMISYFLLFCWMKKFCNITRMSQFDITEMSHFDITEMSQFDIKMWHLCDIWVTLQIDVTVISQTSHILTSLVISLWRPCDIRLSTGQAFQILPLVMHNTPEVSASATPVDRPGSQCPPPSSHT